jgi:hypothetical protein
LPTTASTSSFPTGKAVCLRSPFPALLRKRVHPLVGFNASSEHCHPVSAPRLSTPHATLRLRLGLLPWGSPSLFATSARGIRHDGGPFPPPFRPRRFSRPRRFTPPRTLWVYFTPLPRPGFALQGLSLEHSRDTSSVPRALSSFDDVPLQTVARLCHSPPPRPQGFAPCPSPLPGRRVLIVDRARSPRELSLLQVFPLVAVGTPSRSLRSWPSWKVRRSRTLH